MAIFVFFVFFFVFFCNNRDYHCSFFPDVLSWRREVGVVKVQPYLLRKPNDEELVKNVLNCLYLSASLGELIFFILSPCHVTVADLTCCIVKYYKTIKQVAEFMQNVTFVQNRLTFQHLTL